VSGAPLVPTSPTAARPPLGTRRVLLALALLLAGAQLASAQTGRASAAQQASQGGPTWSTLTPAQRSALAPLERDWASIDPQRKQKWLEIASRMPSMPADERERMQARMHEWAKLSPQERGQARFRYQESRQLTPQERQQRWEAYQALPPEQRQQLAERARPPAPAASGKPPVPAQGPASKSNLVPNPAEVAKQRAVGPTVVQAKPGATTTLITGRPSPPAHQQAGLPKIAATPDFVDRTTLLPQKGPQGAATRSVPAASAPPPHKP
jgi:Protein of unknown function (DUF3106)